MQKLVYRCNEALMIAVAYLFYFMLLTLRVTDKRLKKMLTPASFTGGFDSRYELVEVVIVGLSLNNLADIGVSDDLTSVLKVGLACPTAWSSWSS